MLKPVAILPLIIIISFPARADVWTDYLKIDCEPSIQYFSVLPAGTWSQDVTAPDNFFELSHGWSYDQDGNPIKAEKSDNFAKCIIPNSRGDILFEVVRVRSYPPSGCGGCGAWGGMFQVRLNGTVIVEDNLARVGSLAMRSVRFEGADILICNSPQGTSGFRESDGDGRVSFSCEVIDGQQLEALIQRSKPN